MLTRADQPPYMPGTLNVRPSTWSGGLQNTRTARNARSAGQACMVATILCHGTLVLDSRRCRHRLVTRTSNARTAPARTCDEAVRHARYWETWGVGDLPMIDKSEREVEVVRHGEVPRCLVRIRTPGGV